MSVIESKAKSRKTERGNALFLILITVALFAALSYAVTHSGRGSGTVGREQALLKARTLIDYANLVRATITRMVLSGSNVEDIVLTYDNMVIDTANVCVTGANDENCVFAPNGGDITLQPPALDTCQPPMGGFDCQWHVLTLLNPYEIDGIGTSLPDLILFIPGVDPEICRAINSGMNIDGIPTDPNTADAVIEGQTPGTHAFCLIGAGGVHYFFFALVER